MNFLLRLAIAIAFLYPPADALFNPQSWLGYFPGFMRGIVPDGALLLVWGLIEVVIALWILWGKRIFIPSAAAAIFLVLIVLFNIPLMEIVFRDIALALVAAYLAAENRPVKLTA